MQRIIGNPDGLITTIQHAGRGEADLKKTEAERRADNLVEKARQEADRARDEVLEQARAKAEQKRRQRLAEAAQSAKREYLAGREELLEQVWQKAEERLRSLPDDSEAYAEVLQRLAQLAVRTLGPGDLVLAADSRGHELLTEERLEKWAEEAGQALDDSVSFQRASEPADIWAGLIVTERKSRRRVDSAFSTRLELARDEMRNAIFERLVQQS